MICISTSPSFVLMYERQAAASFLLHAGELEVSPDLSLAEMASVTA